MSDTNNHRIQIFDGQGQYMSYLGEFGGGPEQFIYPQGVVTSSQQERICVADPSPDWTLGGTNSRIQVFGYNSLPRTVAPDNEVAADAEAPAVFPPLVTRHTP